MFELRGLDLALYPFQSNFHELRSGHCMHFVDEGPVDERPVVMVHGNPTWSFYYRELIRGLSDSHRCMALDHVGMGLSDRPPDREYDYTLATRVADFGDWLDSVEPDRPVDLVVHDWGGAIGLSWAAAHPERVRRIVILNTWAFTIPENVDLPRSLALARTWPGALLITCFNAFSSVAARVATESRLERNVVRSMVAPYRGAPSRRLATLRFVQDIPLKQSDPAWSVLAETERNLPRLADCPILLGWGGRDFVFDDRVLDKWREIFPDAELDYIE
ncbi:MAG: alpha/beta fold hydrolase, partial [Wenzhouxiangellaceae bacterium]|nr:alpha/beta fold hydrolase [Wenzhouxiangellaceae bacterium]